MAGNMATNSLSLLAFVNDVEIHKFLNLRLSLLLYFCQLMQVNSYCYFHLIKEILSFQEICQLVFIIFTAFNFGRNTSFHTN